MIHRRRGFCWFLLRLWDAQGRGHACHFGELRVAVALWWIGEQVWGFSQALSPHLTLNLNPLLLISCSETYVH